MIETFDGRFEKDIEIGLNIVLYLCLSNDYDTKQRTAYVIYANTVSEIENEYIDINFYWVDLYTNPKVHKSSGILIVPTIDCYKDGILYYSTTLDEIKDGLLVKSGDALEYWLREKIKFINEPQGVS